MTVASEPALRQIRTPSKACRCNRRNRHAAVEIAEVQGSGVSIDAAVESVQS
jgi:hypothetical protein